MAGAVKSFAGGIQFSLMGVMAESTIVYIILILIELSETYYSIIYFL